MQIGQAPGRDPGRASTECGDEFAMKFLALGRGFSAGIACLFFAFPAPAAEPTAPPPAQAASPAPTPTPPQVAAHELTAADAEAFLDGVVPLQLGMDDIAGATVAI